MSESESLWEFGDVGFDTAKKLWFVQCTGKTNEMVGFRHARAIKLYGGPTAQYQWKDTGGRSFWHIRERFYARDTKSITETPDGEISIELITSTNEQPVPVDFNYLLYAYHLTDKPGAEPASPMGFLEFYDNRDHLITKLDKTWIILESVIHCTVGEYPQIRMRVERAHLRDIVVTSSCAILQGPSPVQLLPSRNTT
jgi:hypothetical protein